MILGVDFMKRFGVVLALAFGAVFFAFSWPRWQSRSPALESSNGQTLAPNAEDLPRWGNVSLAGEFLLLEKRGGLTGISVFFARRAKKGWVPRAMIKELKVSSLTETSGTKRVLGRLYQKLNSLGFYALKSQSVEELGSEWLELAVTDGQRLFQVRRSDNHPVLMKSVEAFRNAVLLSSSRGPGEH